MTCTGSVVSFYVEFSHLSVSPLVLTSLVAGDLVLETEVAVDTEYDDPAATITVGFPSDPDRLLSAGDVDLTRSSSVGSDVNYRLTAPETLSVWLAPGTSTQGTGSVQVLVRRV